MSEPAPTDPKVTRPERTVPYATFQATNSKVKELETQLSTVQTELQAATERAATADTLAQTVAQLKEEHRARQVAWDEERSLLGAGVTDPEDVELVRFQFGRLPAEGKPKSVTDYVASLKAEGAAVPKALTHLFGAPPVAADPPAGGKAAPPKPTGGSGKPPAAGEPVSVDALRTLRIEALRSGDWTAYNQASQAALSKRSA